jgi:hypothetical protein
MLTAGVAAFRSLILKPGELPMPVTKDHAADRARRNTNLREHLTIFASVKRSYPLLVAIGMLGPLQGCATFQKCGFEGCPGDAKITGRVEALLDQHADLAADTLEVSTLNRVVYLNGIVSTDLQTEEAQAVARQAKGVKDVVNNLALSN